MSLNVIELNDTGLRVTRDGVVVCVSPGVALVDAHGVVCGDAALRRAQVQPRDVYQHFWRQLNETPLPDARRHCRHHADLAYHHLASVLDAAGRPAEAVLVVPSHYQDAELALLLGIAAALKLKVAASIVAISSIHLLGKFMEASTIPNDKLLWYTIIHMAFVVSALLLGLLDKMVFQSHRSEH